MATIRKSQRTKSFCAFHIDLRASDIFQPCIGGRISYKRNVDVDGEIEGGLEWLAVNVTNGTADMI